MEVTGTRFGQVRPEKTQFSKKNTSVLGLSELNRMKIGLSEFQGASRKEEDRKRLKALSDARVKNWPNTIQALREKKENERFEKFKKEEMERRRIEKEEEAFQAAQKKILMDKAKLEMFPPTRQSQETALHYALLRRSAGKRRPN